MDLVDLQYPPGDAIPSRPFWTRPKKIAAAVIAVLFLLGMWYTSSAGAQCSQRGGTLIEGLFVERSIRELQPGDNFELFQATWCDVDGDGRPSRDDYWPSGGEFFLSGDYVYFEPEAPSKS